MPRFLKIGLVAMLLAAGVVAYAAPKLPYGPEGKGRFGAYYTTLKYTPEWDAQWRVGPKADVVVRFDQYDYRLVFWRGTNFVPFWVNEKRVWSSDGCVERGNASPKWDKLCKYSFASVVESNDARVVVRWRYALVDKDYKLVNTDPMTNWNDWVDEYYTIYPDAVGIRRVTLHSSDLKSPMVVQQSVIANGPGEALKGQSVASKFGIRLAKIDGADTFQIIPAAATTHPDVKLGTFTDWPVTGSTDAASYTTLDGTTWKAYATDETAKSWMEVVGLTQNGPDALKAVAESWIASPQIIAKGCKSLGYDQGERAYQLACDKPAACQLTLDPTDYASTVYNPAFVIKGWGKRDISLSIEGKPIPRGTDFRYGFRKTETVSDLIVWVKKQSTKPVTFEIKPVGGGK